MNAIRTKPPTIHIYRVRKSGTGLRWDLILVLAIALWIALNGSA